MKRTWYLISLIVVSIACVTSILLATFLTRAFSTTEEPPALEDSLTVDESYYDDNNDELVITPTIYWKRVGSELILSGTVFEDLSDASANGNFKSDAVYTSNGPMNSQTSYVTSVRIANEIIPGNLNRWFYNFTKLTTVDLTNLNSSLAISMSAMFSSCSQLTEIDVSMLNTKNVTSFSSMFYNCQQLRTVIIEKDGKSRFANTKSLTTTDSMFYQCSNLQSINLKYFKNPVLETVASTFYSCTSLESANLLGFNTSNVTNFASMFQNCSKLENVDLRGFDTTKATNIASFFYSCASLKKVNLEYFNFVGAPSVTNFFYNCSKLEELTITKTFAALFDKMSAYASLFPVQSPWYKKDDYNVAVSGVAGFVQRANEMGESAETYFAPYTNKIYWAIFNDGTLHVTDSEFADDADIMASDTGTKYKSSFYGAAYKDPNSSSSTTKSSWFYSYGTHINKIVFEPTGDKPITPAHFSFWFKSLSNLVSIDFSNFDTKWATDAYETFSNSTKLTTLTNFSNLDFGRITTMANMFNNCSSLETITFHTSDGTPLDFKNVTSMYRMFYGATALKTINLSNINASNVTTFQQMFYNCSALENANFAGINTDSVTNIQNMFYNCSMLSELDLSSFNTSNVTDMSLFVSNCFNLTKINVSSFNTQNVTMFNNMFDGCKILEKLDISNFYISEAATVNNMFNNMSALNELGVSKTVAGKVNSGTNLPIINHSPWYNKNDNSIFVDGKAGFTARSQVMADDAREYYINPYTDIIYYGISSNGVLTISDAPLADEYVSVTDTGARREGNFTGKNYKDYVTESPSSSSYRSYFDSYSSLITSVKFMPSGDKPITPAHFSYWFRSLSNITVIDLTGLDTQWVLDFRETFYYCIKLTKIIGLENLNTARVTNMRSLFYNCQLLESLDLSSFNTANVTDMRFMFYQCQVLEALDVSNFNTSKITSMESMFNDVRAIEVLDLSNFDTTNVTSLYQTFYNCLNLKSLKLTNFNTSNVTNFSSTFQNCKLLSELNVTNFDTSAATTLSAMFYGCINLKSLDLSSFVIPESGTTNMLGNLTNLSEITLSKSIATYIANTNFSNIVSASPWYKKDDLTVTVNSNAAISTYAASMESNQTVTFFTPYTITIYWGVGDNGTLTISDEPVTGVKGSVVSSSFLGRDKKDPSNSNSRSYFYSYKSQIERVVVKLSNPNKKITPAYLNSWFRDLTNIESIDLTGIDTSWTMGMGSTFYNCQNLKQIIGLESFDTSKMETMLQAFYNCKKLEAVELSSFDTSNVDEYKLMFYECNSIKKLNLKGFNVKEGLADTLFNRVIYNCNSLNEITINKSLAKYVSSSTTTGSSYDNLNTLKPAAPFYLKGNSEISFGSGKLFSEYAINYYAELENKPAEEITDDEKYLTIVSPYSTKIYFGSLTEGELVISDTVVDDESHFIYGWNYTSTSQFYEYATTTSKVVIRGNVVPSNLYYWFDDFSVVTNYDFTGLDTKWCTTFANAFRSNIALSEINLKNINTSKADSFAYMFVACSSLKEIDLSNFDTSNVTNLSYMFSGCTNLESVNLSSFNTANVITINNMFTHCDNLKKLDLSNFNTSNVTTFESMFSYCYNLLELNLSNFDLSASTKFSYMLRDLNFLRDFRISQSVADKLQSGALTLNGNTPDTTNVWYYVPAELSDLEFSKLNTADLQDYKVESIKKTDTLAGMDRAGRYVIFITRNIYWHIKDGELVLSPTQIYPNAGIVDGVEPEIPSNYYTGRTGFGQGSAPWYIYRDRITSVRIEGTVTPASLSNYFYGLNNLVSANLDGISMQSATLMNDVFHGCTKLKSVNVKTLDVTFVTNFSNLFYGCSSLETLDLSTWSPVNATTFTGMFQNCSSLTLLKLDNFSTPEAIYMSNMFYNCASLTNINVSKFITNNVTVMSSMFYGCTSLESIDLSNFNTENVINVSYMFYNCITLKELNLENFVTPQVNNFTKMFSGCENIEVLNIKGLDASSSKPSASNMFDKMYNLRDFYISDFIAEQFSLGIYYGYSYTMPSVALPWYLVPENQINLPISEIDLSNATEIVDYKKMHILSEDGTKKGARFVTPLSFNIYWAIQDGELVLSSSNNVTGSITGNFQSKAQSTSSPWYAYASDITSVKVEGSISVGNLSYWFSNLTNILSMDLTGLNTKYCRYMNYTFSGCTSLQNIVVNTFDVSNVITMNCCFNNCKALNFLDLSFWVPTNVNDLSYMFQNCVALEQVKLDNFATPNATNMTGMFYNCQLLKTLDLSGFDTTSINYTNNMFYNCYELESLDVSYLDVSKVTSMASMFSNCKSLKHITLGENFVGESVLNIQNMFYKCSSLVSLDLSNFTIEALTSNYSRMLQGLSVLHEIKLSEKMLEIIQKDSYSLYLNEIINTNSPWYERDVAENVHRVTSAKEIKPNTWYKNPYTAEIYWYVTNGKILNISSVQPEEGIEYNAFLGNQSFNSSNIPWADYKNVITDVNFIGVVTPASMACWFENCTALEAVDFTGLVMDKTLNIAYMFNNCSKLNYLDFSNLNMNSVTVYSGFLNGLKNCNSIVINEWQVAKKMQNLGFSVNVPMYNETLDREITKASEMTVAGAYLGGIKVTFSDGKTWSKVVTPGRGNKIDISTIDFSSLPIPEGDEEKHIVYVGLDGWVDENGNDVDFDNVTSNITVYAKFSYIKVSAPTTGLQYNQNSHNIELENPFNYDCEIVYYYSTTLDGIYEIVDNTVNAGFYYASITAGERTTISETYYVAPISITVSNIVAENKQFDQTTNATIDCSEAVVNGVLSGDEVTISATGSFVSASIGENIAVTVTEVLTGNVNYIVEDLSFDLTANILAKDIDSNFEITGIENKTYTGNDITQNFVVTVDGKRLTSGVDYTYTYNNNINAGTATIEISGTGNYTGIKSVEFDITKKNIADGDLTISVEPATYTGDEITTLEITITYAGNTLKDTDYTVGEFTNNINAGSGATVTISGAGDNFEGTRTIPFRINPLSLLNSEVEFKDLEESYQYDGNSVSPTFTLMANGKELVKNTDYTVFYLNNTKPGFATIRVTGRGNYTGTITTQYSIVAKGFNDCTIEFENNELIYNGASQKQIPTVLDASGNEVSDTNYTISYSTDTTNVGTVTVTITGRNEYIYAVKTATYQIVPMDISGEATIGDIENQVYNREQQKPSLTVTVNEKVLVAGTDYIVTYQNNISVGTATAIITGSGNYTGEVSTTFEIIKASITNITLQAKQVYFNGKQQIPQILSVKAGNFNLKEDEYSVTYLNEDDTLYTEDFINAGTIKISVTALDTQNYSGSCEILFTIRPAILSNLVLENINFQFDTTEHNPVVLKVSASNGYVLSAGEYVIEGFRFVDGRYETTPTTDFTSAGKIKIVATGKNNNFSSTASQIMEISALSLHSSNVTIKYYFVTVDNEGNYTPVVNDNGEKVYMVTDQIIPGMLVMPEITYAISENQTYTLVKDVDFTFTQVTLDGNEDGSFTSIGRYKSIIEGKGSFEGIVENTYKINPRPFSPEYIRVTQNKASFEYTGGAVVYNFDSNDIIVEDIYDIDNPLKLLLNTHFELCNQTITVDYGDGISTTLSPVNGYINNTSAGTAILVLIGKDGRYSDDVIIVNFEITGRSINNCVLEKIEDQTFNASYIRPNVNLTAPISDTENYILQENLDYTVSYENNFNAGIATIVITGINNFSGVIEKSFVINAKDISVGDDIIVSGLDTVVYNTKEQMPVLQLIYKIADREDVILLESDDYIERDFAVVYSSYDFVNPNTITVYIFGTGNYTGVLEKTYVIDKLPITSIDVYDKVYSIQYSGNAYDLISKIIVNYEIEEKNESGSIEKVIGTVNSSDYVLYYQVFDDDGMLSEKYELNSSVQLISAGVYRITVEAKESSVYKVVDNIYFDFEITAFSLTSENIEDLPSVIFTGDEIQVDPVVIFNGVVLKKNVDYKVLYSDNVNVGEATVIVKGQGSYKGTATKTFEILPKDIGFADIEITNNELIYNGTNLELTGEDISLVLDDITLVYNTDFIIEYEDDQRIVTGTYNFNAKGIGNYEGITMQYEFSIIPRDLSTLDFSNMPSVEYTGKLLTPEFTLLDNFGNTQIQIGSDVVLTYGDAITNVNVAYKVENGEWVIDKQGIILVKAGDSGNYIGETTIYFAITPVDLSSSQIKVQPITGIHVFQGEPIRPIPTVIFNNGTEDITLEPSLFDYTYINNNVAGNATVTVNAYPRTNYVGAVSIEFEITDPNARPDLKDAVIQNKFADVTYNGLDQTPDFSLLEVYMGEIKLEKGVDYLIEYSKAADYFVTVGKKEINIVAVKDGSYKGSQKFAFNILGVDDTITVYLYNKLDGDGQELSEWTYKELDINNVGLKVEVESMRNPTVEIYKVNEDGTEMFLENFIEDAGEYYVKVSVRASGNYRAMVATYYFTIKQREITFSGITAESKVYDGQTDAIINLDGLTFSGLLVDDEISLTADLLFEDANVGENKTVYITNVKFIGASANNYKLAESGSQQTTTASITKKEISASLNIPSSNMQFGNVEDVTFEIENYQGDVSSVFILAFTDENGETTYEMPVNAGTYTVSIEFIDKAMADNYQFSTTSTTTANFTISKIGITTSMVQAIESQDYTGNSIEPEINILSNGNRLILDVDFTKQYSNNIEVGTATVTITGIGNYSGEITISFSIVMPEEEITNLTIDNWTYGDKNIPTPKYNAPAFVTVEIMYSLTADIDGEYSTEVPTKAGIYFVKAFISGKEETTAVTYRFRILPKEISANINIKDYNYYEQIIDPTVTISGLVGEDGIDIIVTYICDELGYNSTEKPTDVGVYTIIISTTNSNYIFTENNKAVFAINPVTTNAKVNIENFMYGDEISTPVAIFTVNDQEVSFNDYKIVYSTSEDGEYSETMPVNAGTYYAKVLVTDDSNQTFIIEVSSFEITKRIVTVKELKAENKVYDATTNVNLTVSKVDGILDGDDISVTAIGAFESKDVKNNRIVNATEFVLSGEDVDNYVIALSNNITFARANILAKEITVNIVANSGKYNSVESVVYNIEGSIEGETNIIRLVYTNEKNEVIYTMPEDVGVYTITVELLDTNYVLTESPTATLTITPADITDVVVEFYQGIYDGLTHDAVTNATATTVDGSIVTWSFSLDSGENKVYGEMPVFKDAGTYVVYYKVSADNHQDYYGQFTVTIGKAELVISVSDKSIVVGDEVPSEYKYNVTGLAEGEELLDVVSDFNITCDYVTTAEIGDKFDIIATGTANNNYNLTIKNGVLTVVEEITNLVLTENSKLHFSIVNADGILESIDRESFEGENTIYLTGIKNQTSLSDLLTQFENSDLITATDINGDAIDETSVVGTGTVITNGVDSVTIIVVGDLSGDGELDGYDKTLLQTILEEVYEAPEVIRLAADLSGDGVVDGYDKTLMQTHLEEVINIYDEIVA